MPSLTTAVPKYRKKKVNGGKNSYAVVCINGREHVLGPYNSRASKVEYDRLIGQFIASGRSAGFGRHEHHVKTLRQLVIEYGKWAKEHYVRVRLQRFTGMRPQEVCDIKFGDIQTINGNVYYYPKHHKTIHKGKIRAVPLNANVLSLLSKYNGTADEFIFSPQKSRERQIAIRTAKRVTPLSCGTKPKKDRIINGGDHYTSCSYRRAIYRVCDRLFFGLKGYKWSPNQLRHAAAVEIDTEHGIEAVGAALGHSKIAISRRYAKQNLKLATKAAAMLFPNSNIDDGLEHAARVSVVLFAEKHNLYIRKRATKQAPAKKASKKVSNPKTPPRKNSN